jgi:hypothetical protein
VKGLRTFFRALFTSPAQRHADAVAVFRSRGFTAAEAECAARDIWLACRTGTRTPPWIMERLREAKS